jgi:caffeoyl-CoA O-methyltransferase
MLKSVLDCAVGRSVRNSTRVFKPSKGLFMKSLVLPEIEAYAEAHSTPESSVCRALREETHRTMEYPQMLVGPLEGAFLKMMAQLVGAKRVLEIGMFTGYSALCFAEALPADGTVTTCEINEKSAAVARRYFAQALVGGKINVRMGPALDTMRTLAGPFDVIFIDADKTNYMNYYQRSLDLLTPNGVILIDNVLWSGEVLKQPPPDESTAAIQELNRTISTDPRVTAVLVTIRDGILVVRRA